MGIELSDEQKLALTKMHNGCVLRGEVGSGKSRTALTYYYLHQGGRIYGGEFLPMFNPKDLLIITTPKKRNDKEWEWEMMPFIMGENNNFLYNNKIVVDSWNNIQKYKDWKDSFVIFDEQRAVGKGPWAKTFIKIARQNQWILLSATPGDNWGDYIPLFLANGFYKNRTDFNNQHAIYTRYPTYTKVTGYHNEYKLEKLKREIIVPLKKMRDIQSEHQYLSAVYDVTAYKSANKLRWNPFTDAPIERPAELCQVLRRIVNGDASRIDIAKGIVASCECKKVIIFYNYNYELDILRQQEWLTYDGEACDIGEWNGHRHDPIPDSDCWVYLVQYTAGAEGWNCVLTDTMIFYSENYSYKVMVQAAGRIDRMNTPFQYLYYYHIRTHSSIDLAIARALKEKREFNERDFVRGKG